MFLDRTAIPAEFSALQSVPLVKAIETLRWSTRIFISANHTETRIPLTLFPTYTIQYSFNLKCTHRSTLTSLQSGVKSQWVLPYFPHLTQATVTSTTIAPATDTVDDNGTSIWYPYQDYYLALARGSRGIYLPATETSPRVFEYGDQLADAAKPIFIVPCYTAFIDPRTTYSDKGDRIDGSTASITWRLAGESEILLGDINRGDNCRLIKDFKFLDRLQRPKDVNVNRHQTLFDPRPAKPATYSMTAKKADQQQTEQAKYFLVHNATQKSDYGFKFYFLRYRGADKLGELIEAGTNHRLADDMIRIIYEKGYAWGELTARLVA